MSTSLQDFDTDAAQADVTRTLPHAVGCEKSVLSSCLRDPQEFVPLAVELGFTPETFYLPAHTVIFTEILRKFHLSEEIELTSFVQSLLDRGQLDRAGGPASICDVYGYSVTDASFRHHAEIVREKLILRSLIEQSNQIIAECYEGPENPADLLDAAEARIMAIREGGQTQVEESMGKTMDRVVDRILAVLKGEQGAIGTSTGFNGLDDLGATLKPGNVFVIAARPSMGKTAFMMNVVERMAVDLAENTLVFSTEMSKEDVLHRLTCTRAKVAVEEMRKGKQTPTKGDLQRLQRASLEIASAPLHINDKAGITIGEIRAIARRRHRRSPLKFIAIDYLQFIRSSSKQAANNREREVAEISCGVKTLAKELAIPIMLLAQLNRGPEGRTGNQLGVPRMSDLRESGAIEQDADMIGLLYRQDYYATTPEEKDRLLGQAKIILAKNRNGETGEAPLTFIAPLTRFEDGAPAQEHDMFQEPARRSRHDHDN